MKPRWFLVGCLLIAGGCAEKAASTAGAPGPDRADEPTSSVPSSESELQVESEEPDTLEQAVAAFDDANAQLEKIVGGAGSVPLSQGGEGCDDACAAFASLEKAAEGICRLAKEEPERCAKAEAIVDRRRTDVGACGCAEK